MARLVATTDCFVKAFYAEGEVVEASGEKEKRLRRSGFFRDLDPSEPKEAGSKPGPGRPRKNIEIK